MLQEVTNVAEQNLEEAGGSLPRNVEEFAKRKGILPLVKKVAGWAEKSGKKILGGTAIGKNYNTLLLDLTWQQEGEIAINILPGRSQVLVYDEPVNDYESFQQAIEGLEEKTGMEEQPRTNTSEETEERVGNLYRYGGIKTKYGSSISSMYPQEVVDTAEQMAPRCLALKKKIEQFKKQIENSQEGRLLLGKKGAELGYTGTFKKASVKDLFDDNE